MSDAIFPTLRGWAYPMNCAPEFKTSVNTSDTGTESRVSKWSAPKWHYELVYEGLDDTAGASAELQTLQAFFLAREGQYDTFLFLDQTNNAVSGQPFGQGDGTTASFQLVRSLSGFVEPVYGIVAAPVITVNGVATTAFTWTTTGMITFAAPPAKGALVVWSGSYYMRVRFETDSQEFQNFLAGEWGVQSLKLMSTQP